MADRLSNFARSLIAALWKRWRGNRDPAKLPWPPGVDVRALYRPKIGATYQLREGARLPDNLYLYLMKKARDRASIQSRKPCKH